MSATVFITFPDNRRKPYKVTPMMTLQTILVNACKDAKIDNPETFTLKENRKELDLTLPFRFTNLAPGAKLTLVKSTKPVKSAAKVLIALQMPEGGRLNDNFLITTTLWDVLLHFEERSKGALNLTRKVEKESSPKNTLKKLIKSDKYVYVQPVCIVLNKEYGTIEDLKKTTLKSAGINEDTMIRMLFKFTDKSLNDVLPLIEADISNSNNTTSDIQVPKKELPKQESLSQNNLKNNSSLASTNNENKKIKVQPPIQPSAQPLVQQQIQPPTQPSVQPPVQQQVQPPTQSSAQPPVQQQVQPPTQSLVQPPVQQQVQPPTQSSIQPSIQQQKNNNLNDEKIVLEKINRNIQFYNPPRDDTIQYNKIDLPDSFFELSQFEMRLLISQQTKKQKELENMPLKTKAMREQEDEQKRKKYPKCLIRVKFPNRVMIEITFLSNELVSDLYKEVEAVLYSKDKPFYLYTTPPKAILSDKSKTLWKAGLVPSSNVYFNWSDEKDKELEKRFLAPEYEKQLKDLNIENTPVKVPAQNNRNNYNGAALSGASSGHSLSSSSNNILNRSNNNISRLSSDSNSNSDNRKSTKMKMPKWFKLQ
ncbi:hypothetical protein BCR36DRAFT_329670 [Piromyces finnis]|uniref:UBX domain-containing protein n=1 Tax=Piromyces finnis TaxID=1754191 RepID=A0A1Y1V624_9FUNG|nr:hypothetical protein BCR36DRAFT_329670 [Piromyces finnis]|eukprot:ORX48106.1 hypothetical protein BCR36DRAFT_329670 [Piromyces finnis]